MSIFLIYIPVEAKMCLLLVKKKKKSTMVEVFNIWRVSVLVRYIISHSVYVFVGVCVLLK